MSDMKPTLPISIVALLVVAFLQVPVLVVVLTSFSETSYLTIPPQGWTLKWFAEVLSDPVYLRAIWNSVILAVSSTLLSLVLGVAAAYALFRKAIPGSEAITALLMAPLIVPSVVIGVAMLQYVTLVGLRGSFLVLIVAHVVITVPYILRSALASLSGLDVSVEEAARVLGADGFTAFRLVTLPLIKPGLVAGALFAFVTSMENVPVTIFLASARQTTLPILIFSSVEMGVNPGVAAISTLLIIATVIVLLLAERWAGFHKFV
ncbi:MULTISPECIES: ABC transporter permease [Paracoccus]|uniref:Binding-protein-dependent transport systems inner membrane component n=1 Tax=Paracoccus denitrificans (strain Pd 1222) TaxID=318586 RepID=A1BC66_PARDP|nr:MULTISPECIES: ABC transporter permease [Paracoccus]ABL73110.1 binding-protein-dependent transport systems inner membrane component [Paracoccus denitrificans PD1222]MBB4628591.1 putative spermidine/putrescine transport system permease protein [Paracoccus denitrificans]MCU7431485.1 ABC transporter permease [Paracoccus denitrificans]MDK8871409.1 ABC transporter permease [Paracoccus sp. SSJ]QAR29494.1 ABC transporter permease [Paracoccus denitrificans]